VSLVAFKRLKKDDRLNRSFIIASIGVLLGLFFETLSVYFNNNSQASIIVLNNIVSVIIFILAPIISFSFLLFIMQLIYSKLILEKRWFLLLLIPVISNVILSVLSPFYGVFFSISSNGVYMRGPLFILSAFSTYVYMLIGIILVLYNFKRMLKQDAYLVLGIGILPIIGGLIQALVYGVLTMWSSGAAALVLGYLFLQERMIHVDALTGVWNRASFYNTFSRKIYLNPNDVFGAIYFDLDNLKKINDVYGHIEGDYAIKSVVKVASSKLPNDAIVCRLGGDEFIALFDCDQDQTLNQYVKEIKQAFNDFNKTNDKAFMVDCSFGQALFTKEFGSLNALISRLDVMMYQEKEAKRQK
jgi:diguanylate cyclase (GGDEF)-like protein